MPANPETAFNDATDRFGPALQRLVRGYEAEPTLQAELKQDVLLALWRALPTFRGDASLRTFVFRVAHNTAIKHVHKHARDRSEPGLEEGEVAAAHHAPEANLDRARMRQALANAIRKLPDLDRELSFSTSRGSRTATWPR